LKDREREREREKERETTWIQTLKPAPKDWVGWVGELPAQTQPRPREQNGKTDSLGPVPLSQRGKDGEECHNHEREPPGLFHQKLARATHLSAHRADRCFWS
jgi:hypothetical protein